MLKSPISRSKLRHEPPRSMKRFWLCPAATTPSSVSEEIASPAANVNASPSPGRSSRMLPYCFSMRLPPHSIQKVSSGSIGRCNS